MSWHPTFKLYQTNGTTLVYHIENVTRTNYPQEQPSSIQLTNLRSQGAIIIPGGDKAWTLELGAILIGDDYTDLTDKILELRDTIVANTRYVLKIDTSISATEEINIIRVEPIIFEDSLRTSIQRYTLRLLANSW